MAYIPPFLHYTIPNILVHFGQSLSPEATAALVEKDAFMRADNESRRVEIINLQGRCTVLNRSLEEEIRIRNIREKETGKRDENEQLLHPTNSDLTYCHNKNGRIEGIQRVSGVRKTEMEEEVSRMKTAAEEKERVIAELQAEICKLKADICESKNGMLVGFERILEENTKLEKEVKVNFPKLVESVNVLRRDIGEKEEEIRKAKGEVKSCNRLVEDMQKKNEEYACRICVLEKEKEAMESELDDLRKKEAELRKVKIEKNGVVKRSNETKKRNRELAERIGVLEKEKGVMEAELDELRKTGCEKGKREAESWKVNSDKNVVAKIIKRAEEDKKNKLGVLAERIVVLEREKEVMEAELDESQKTVCEQVVMIKKKNAMIKRIEDDVRKRTSELVEQNRNLGREKGEMEEKLQKDIMEMRAENERILNEKAAAEAVKNRVEAELKKEKGGKKSEMEEKLQKDIMKMRAENERILNEKAAVEVVKNRVEVELKKEKGEKKSEMEKIMKQKLRVEEENSKLIEMIQAKDEEVLKSQKERNSVTCRMQNMKKASEQARMHLEKEKEKDKEISDQEKRVVVLESEKAELEAAVEKVKKDKSDEADRNAKVEKTLEAQMKQVEELEVMNSKNLGVIEGLMKVNEVLVAKISKVNMEKNNEIERIKNEKLALEEQKKTISEHLKRTEVLETEKLELKAKVCRLLKADTEKRKEIERFSNEKIALEEEKKKILDHVKRIEVLEREKAELKAKVCKVMIDKKNESEKIVKLNKDLQTQKSLAEAADKHVSGILETIMVVEREKEELQAEVLKLIKEKSKGIERTERLERIQKILNGNLAQEAEKDYEKKNLELGDRIMNLEKEKRGLEADLRKKNKAIMVLENENRLLEDMTKKLEMEISGMASKSKEDVQLFQHASLTYNGGTLSTTPLQNEGQNTVAVPRVIVNTNGKHGGEMTNKNACKRKRSPRKFDGPVSKLPKPSCEPLPVSLRSPVEPVLPQQEDLVPCEKNAQMVSTKHSNGSSVSDVRVACRWEVDQDVLDALDVDDELCLKAVCALYRKHTADASPSSESRVFKEPESTLRAITIGEYLTIEDPDCRKTKKMVGKLNKIDNLALGACRTIAKEHYKQVFEIYNKKEDPLYLS